MIYLLFGQGGDDITDTPLWGKDYLENDKPLGIIDFIKMIEPVEEKEEPVIIIDSTEEDDWIKSRPGYQDEVKLHQELAKKHKKKS